MPLFLIFVAVPIVEIALFIEVGGALGLWPTLAIVIATAALGSWLLRSQGVGAMADLQASLSGRGDPGRALAHGAMILGAGMLLLTPGFFTDACGFALMVPAVRDALIAWGGRRMEGRVHMTGIDGAPRDGSPHGRPAREETVEAEFEVVEERDPEGRGRGEDRGDDAPPSGWTRRD